MTRLMRALTHLGRSGELGADRAGARLLRRRGPPLLRAARHGGGGRAADLPAAQAALLPPAAEPRHRRLRRAGREPGRLLLPLGAHRGGLRRGRGLRRPGAGRSAPSPWRSPWASPSPASISAPTTRWTSPRACWWAPSSGGTPACSSTASRCSSSPATRPSPGSLGSALTRGLGPHRSSPRSRWATAICGPPTRWPPRSASEILHVDRPPLVAPEEQRLWRASRRLYEATSRASQIPVVGAPLALAPRGADRHPPPPPAARPLRPHLPGPLAAAADRQGVGTRAGGPAPRHRRAAPRHLLRPRPLRRLPRLREGLLRGDRRGHQPRLGAAASARRRRSST